MKIKFLGTAAAEGIPAIFCMCDACVEARKRKGRNIRTRSQAIIDDKLLIDFPGDTYMHCLDNDIELAKIKNCLITHTHTDHLYFDEISMRKPVFSNLPQDDVMTFYGLAGAMERIDKELAAEDNKMAKTQVLTPYTKTQIDDYTITTISAIHDPTSFPAFYIIEDKEGKTVLWAHDTNYFSEEMWEFFKDNNFKFDLVSLDCTEGNRPTMHYVGHMNLNDNIRIKNRLIEMNCADENTIFVSNHFSHNGFDIMYEEFSEISEKEGIIASYDGMEKEF